MNRDAPRLIVCLKAPQPGRVKTRLAAAIGPRLACDAYRAMAAGVLEAARDSGLPTTVHFSPADREADIRALCGPTCPCRPQIAGDLGQRMEAAMAREWADGAPAVLLVGGDLPLLTAAILLRAARELAQAPAVLGPAEDGGYYLLGLTRPAFGPHLFRDMPWSTDGVAARTLVALQTAGTPARLLPLLPDCDTVADLAACARAPLRARLSNRPLGRFLDTLPADLFDQTLPYR